MQISVQTVLIFPYRVVCVVVELRPTEDISTKTTTFLQARIIMEGSSVVSGANFSTKMTAFLTRMYLRPKIKAELFLF